MLGKLEGSRWRGRQNIRWIDPIKKVAGFSWQDLGGIFNDRIFWKSVVHRVNINQNKLRLIKTPFFIILFIPHHLPSSPSPPPFLPAIFLIVSIKTTQCNPGAKGCIPRNPLRTYLLDFAKEKNGGAWCYILLATLLFRYCKDANLIERSMFACFPSKEKWTAIFSHLPKAQTWRTSQTVLPQAVEQIWSAVVDICRLGDQWGHSLVSSPKRLDREGQDSRIFTLEQSQAINMPRLAVATAH